MTELAIQDAAPQPSTVANYTPTPSLSLAKVDLDGYWGRMGVAIQIAGPMCKTPFVPAAFRNKPEDTAMAIMYGFKYGMEPDAALSSIFIIGGRPGMYSRVQHAILLANGHDVRITRQSDEVCVVKGRRKGDDGDYTESVWTIERAKKAGYFTNDKYTKDPIAMLTARALGDVCRLVAPDLLMGIVAYNEADVEVMEVINGDTLEPMQAEPVKVQRRVAAAAPAAQAPRPFVNVAPAAPAPAPVQEAAPLVGDEANDSDVVDEAREDQEVDYDDGVQDGPSNVFQLPQAQAIALANETQIAVMMDEMNKAGHRTIAAKRKAAKEFVGRDLEGPHQMTADEADAFINHLMRQAATTTEAVDAAWGLTNTTTEDNQ